MDRTVVTNRSLTVASPEVAINVGSNADYIDGSGRVWVADRPFSQGHWGFTGSGAVRVYGNPPDRNILTSNDDPMLQTFVEGIESYKLDVPAGSYSVELLFAETRFEQAGKRVFDVRINSKPVLTDLDLVASPGAFRPFIKTFDVRTSGGIEISFTAKTGKAILNGVRVARKN